MKKNNIKKIKKFIAKISSKIAAIYRRKKHYSMPNKNMSNSSKKHIINYGNNENKCEGSNQALQQISKDLIEFVDTRVSEIMIPRTEIVAAPSSVTGSELNKRFISTKLTRMPIYKKNLDDVIGFVHVKDVLRHASSKDNFEIESILRQLIYLPRSTKCIDLLMKMRTEGTHLAIILDEYGGTEGLVTIGRILEEIIGNISDEHNANKNDEGYINQISSNTYILDAKTPIQDLEKQLENMDFLSNEEGEYETLGGFLLAYLGYIPKKSQKLKHPAGIKMEILDANSRSIKKVKMTIPDVENNKSISLSDKN
jgi:magnesium and cobalt transporter